MNIPGLLESARLALSTTYRERCHLPGSPWFAFFGAFGGIIVARTDNPEQPIPADWRQLAPVNNARSDEQNMVAIRDALQRQPLPGSPRSETHCADCGAAFPPVPASGGAAGYATTRVPLLPPSVRTLDVEGTNHGTEPRDTSTPKGATLALDSRTFPARYDVEGHDEAQRIDKLLGGETVAIDGRIVATKERRICYACCAVLESETMIAHGRGCLYLTSKEWKPGDPHRGHVFSRNTTAGLYRYTYSLSNWPGNAPFPLLGIVKESRGQGFGGSYPVRTFRFRGPDGYVWSGRVAGDMDLARCKRTKERAK